MTVTDVPGFVAGGTAAGIKVSGAPDLAYVGTADGRPAVAAGVFTRNQMTAAPVIVCREHLAATGGAAAGVIVNSGNANAATGQQGLADARGMAATTAAAVGVDPNEILVCSTGLIGFPMEMAVVNAAIPTVVSAADADGGLAAAVAMMTTDTVPKTAVTRCEADRGTASFGGIAKGAAMLEPNMATMLAVLTTDADVGPGPLTAVLREAVGVSFNALTVDGAESTNDTVLMLATGAAGPVPQEALAQAVTELCQSLAVQMADDAEGSTKTVHVRVVGATEAAEAAAVARSIANNQLIKCSWYGQDPYWGRIAAEAGSAATTFDPAELVIRYGDHVVYDHGEPVAAAATPGLEEYMKGRELRLSVRLGPGPGEAAVVTTDLSHAYIDENMSTS